MFRAKPMLVLSLLILLSSCSALENEQQAPPNVDEIISSQEIDENEVGLVISSSKIDEIDESVVEPVSNEDDETGLVISANDIDIFRPFEATIMDISLYDELELLTQKIGHPDSIETVFEGTFGADVYYYHYDFGRIRLQPGLDDDYYVSHFNIWGDEAVGPRGITIGDSVQTVIDKFSIKEVRTSSDYVFFASEFDKFLYLEGDETYGIMCCDADGEIKEIYYQYVNITDETFEACGVRFAINNGKVTVMSILALYNH